MFFFNLKKYNHSQPSFINISWSILDVQSISAQGWLDYKEMYMEIKRVRQPLNLRQVTEKW